MFLLSTLSITRKEIHCLLLAKRGFYCCLRCQSRGSKFISLAKQRTGGEDNSRRKPLNGIKGNAQAHLLQKLYGSRSIANRLLSERSFRRHMLKDSAGSEQAIISSSESWEAVN